VLSSFPGFAGAAVGKTIFQPSAGSSHGNPTSRQCDPQFSAVLLRGAIFFSAISLTRRFFFLPGIGQCWRHFFSPVEFPNAHCRVSWGGAPESLLALATPLSALFSGGGSTSLVGRRYEGMPLRLASGMRVARWLFCLTLLMPCYGKTSRRRALARGLPKTHRSPSLGWLVFARLNYQALSTFYFTLKDCGSPVRFPPAVTLQR